MSSDMGVWRERSKLKGRRKMSKRKNRTFDPDKLKACLIRMRFDEDAKRVVVQPLPWDADETDGPEAGGRLLGYSVLIFNKDRSECVVSDRLYWFASNARGAFVECDRWKLYLTYGEALASLCVSDLVA